MNRNDTATRRVTTAIVLGVGLFAGGDSYAHIYDLARASGWDVISAALLPLAGDGLVAAASAVMLVASRQGHDIPARARVMLIAGIAATVAANLAYGLSYGHTSALLSIWAPLAYVGCLELLAWMRAHTGMQPAKARPAVASADAPEPPAQLAAARARRAVRQPARDLLSAAEEAFPNARQTVPPLREIQTKLSVGQPKAQAVQRHFRTLQATA